MSDLPYFAKILVGGKYRLISVDLPTYRRYDENWELSNEVRDAINAALGGSKISVKRGDKVTIVAEPQRRTFIYREV